MFVVVVVVVEVEGLFGFDYLVVGVLIGGGGIMYWLVEDVC